MPKRTHVTQTGQIGAAEHQLINRQILARAVGYLAMCLPFVLFGLGYGLSCAFDTISHYYFGPLTGSVFVGTASAVALALVAYSGKTRFETTMATLAALALVVVALVPTQNVGCEKTQLSARVFATAQVSPERDTVVLKPFSDAVEFDQSGQAVPVEAHFRWAIGAATVHTVAAGIFILILAYFCFFIFTRTDAAHLKADGSGDLTDEKKSRNRKYRQSGWVIVLSLIALVLGLFLTGGAAQIWDYYNGTFVFESIAILAFARSWLLKGRASVYRDLSDADEEQARAICEASPGFRF